MLISDFTSSQAILRIADICFFTICLVGPKVLSAAHNTETKNMTIVCLQGKKNEIGKF